MIAACLCETQWEINSKHWKNCIAFMSSSVSCHAMITFKHLPSFIRVIATEGRIWLFPILKTFFSISLRKYFWKQNLFCLLKSDKVPRYFIHNFLLMHVTFFFTGFFQELHIGMSKTVLTEIKVSALC